MIAFMIVVTDKSLKMFLQFTIYMTQRAVNGFSFSSPARGHPSVREARARLGYFKQLNRHLLLDVLIEKRSFYFVEAGLPSLYTKSGTAAAEFTYLWY